MPFRFEQPLLEMISAKAGLGSELAAGAGRRVRTGLGTSHQVSFGLDDGDGILLDRRGPSVAGQRDVAHDDLPHVHVMELEKKKRIIRKWFQLW